MVVYKLQTYVENEIPKAVQPSNLRELVNQELKCRGETPTVVLDASAALILFPSKGFMHVDWQPNIIKKNVEKLVENIISCGVNLITVLRSKSPPLKQWYNKHYPKYMKAKKELNVIMGKGTKEENTNNCVRSTACLNHTFASIKNPHYKVFSAVGHTHKEVAKIAISQNCFAIIGQDSNYLIYEGIRHFILTASLNTETLDCSIYSRSKVMEHLGLKSSHMPLFATLCGNDVVFYQLLYNFHRKILKSHTDKFLCIAEIIKHLSEDPYQHINYIKFLINNPKLESDIIKKSIDMYLNFRTVSPNNKWLTLADERLRACAWGRNLYKAFTSKILTNSRITSVGDSGLMPASTLMRSLRAKIYGILFNDIFEPVNEYYMEEIPDANPKLLVPVKVLPVKPVCEHPGLIQLFAEDNPNIHCMRWNLFCSSISRTLKQFTVRDIPPRLLVPVLALHYLEVEAPSLSCGKIFETLEIEAFLVVALLVHEEVELGDVDFDSPDIRVVTLILYFLEACQTLELLNEACGLIVSRSQACHCNFFNGIMLHLVYQEMKEGAKWYQFFEGNIGLEAMYCSLLEIILN